MNDWIEAICDADFRTVLGSLDFANVSLMLLNTLEEAIKYHTNEEREGNANMSAVL